MRINYPDVVWGYVSSYAPNLKRSAELDSLIQLAVNYYKEKIEPYKKYRLPDEKERKGLIELVQILKTFRPSWKFGTKTINHDFEKAFKFFDEQKKIKKNKVIDKKLENCFKVLELNSDSTLKEIKSRYKILA